MVKAIVRYVWDADVSLELRNMALAVQYDEVKRGGRTVRIFRPQDWYNDGNIMIDVGKRLRGWFIQQSRTVKPSLADALRYGLKCDSVPAPGSVEVAKTKDITPNSAFLEKDKTEYYLGEELEKVGYPFKEVFSVTEGGKMRSVFAFHYIIDKPIPVKAKIHSFARGFLPGSAEEMLKKIGVIIGLGDRYAQGYGCFKLIDFKSDVQELNI